jgi:hypothetical protein
MNLFHESKKILDKDGKVNPLGPYGKQKLTGQEIANYFRKNKVSDAKVKKAVEVALDLGGAFSVAQQEIKKFFGNSILKKKEVQNALRYANEEFQMSENFKDVIKMFPRDNDWKKLITKHKRHLDDFRKGKKDLDTKVEDDLVSWALDNGEIRHKEDVEDFIDQVLNASYIPQGDNMVSEDSIMSYPKKNEKKIRPMLMKIAKKHPKVKVSFGTHSKGKFVDDNNINFKGQDKDVDMLMKDIQNNHKNLVKMMEAVSPEQQAAIAIAKKEKKKNVMDSYKEMWENGEKYAPEPIEEACWDGYVQKGFKMKNGKQVPNCVPVSEDIQEGKLSDAIIRKDFSNVWAASAKNKKILKNFHQVVNTNNYRQMKKAYQKDMKSFVDSMSEEVIDEKNMSSGDMIKKLFKLRNDKEIAGVANLMNMTDVKVLQKMQRDNPKGFARMAAKMGELPAMEEVEEVKEDNLMNSYRDMSEAKSFNQKDIDIVAKFTDKNEHTLSLMHIAKVVGDKKAGKKLELIYKMHNEYGSMTKDLMSMRNAIYDDLKKQMKRYDNYDDMYGAT